MLNGEVFQTQNNKKLSTIHNEAKKAFRHILLCIEKELLQSIDVSNIVKTYAFKKARKSYFTVSLEYVSILACMYKLCIYFFMHYK